MLLHKTNNKGNGFEPDGIDEISVNKKAFRGEGFFITKRFYFFFFACSSPAIESLIEVSAMMFLYFI